MCVHLWEGCSSAGQACASGWLSTSMSDNPQIPAIRGVDNRLRLWESARGRRSVGAEVIGTEGSVQNCSGIEGTNRGRMHE